MSDCSCAQVMYMHFCYNCMGELENEGLEVCPHCGKQLEFTCDTTRFLKPGTILQGKFVVGRVLGAGGFGNTYIGWNQILQCKVAIKEYFPRQLSSRNEGNVTVTVSDTVNQQRFQSGLQQFLAEARSIASLKDVRGVVQIFNFFEENGTGYIIMEFLEGMDVKEILKQRGEKMDYEWSRRVILTVLHTLREVHNRGILHRDIAPDNIFVTNEGVIKLIDFGAAKHATETAAGQSGVVLKIGYAPIEQYGRNAKQGIYTDLYAVAAMFYRMLTGIKPQPANERVIQDKLLSLSDMGVIIPEQAEFAIMVCLNVQPQYRLQSAQEFMEALEGEDFLPVYEPEWILPEIKEDSGNILEKLMLVIHKMAIWQKVLVLAVFLLIVGSMTVTVHYRMTDSSKGKELIRKGDIHLPTCEEKSVQEAEETLKELGVEVDITYRYKENCTEDTVIAMEPAAGSMVNKGDVIYLTVQSAEYVSIPDYSGKSWKEIKSDMQDLLGNQYTDKIIAFDYTDSDKEKERCYSQSVVGTMKIAEISDFKVWISWGRKEDYLVKMPDLVGKTYAQAKKILASRGIKTKLTETETIYDDAPAGEIVFQNVKKGKLLNTNTADKKNYFVPKEVMISVSKGPRPEVVSEPVTTPVPAPNPTKKPEKKNQKDKKNPFTNSDSKNVFE